MLSIIIPVFNEERTLLSAIERIEDVNLPMPFEIILIDDGSTDKTRQIIKTLDGRIKKVLTHDSNQGKGAAVRSGLSEAAGEIIVIHDADLEYDPNDWPRLLKEMESSGIDVVYGSRFLGNIEKMAFTAKVANKFLTFLTRLFFKVNLTDMETCMKMIRSEALIGLELQSNDFTIEPEITIKLLRKGYKILEVPISYSGRTLQEGKKIKTLDGIKAALTLIKYKLLQSKT